jgi:hypothetical protein
MPEILTQRRAEALQADLKWEAQKRQWVVEEEAHYAKMDLAHEEELRGRIKDPQELEERLKAEREWAKERGLMRQRQRDHQEEVRLWEDEDRRNNPMKYAPIGERRDDPPEVKAPPKPLGPMEAFALDCLKAGLESPYAPGFIAFVQKAHGVGDDLKQFMCDPRNWDALMLGFDRALQLGVPGRFPGGRPPMPGYAMVHPGVQVYPGMPMGGGGGGGHAPQDNKAQILYNQQGNAAGKDQAPKKGGMYELKFGENGKVERERVFDNGANNMGQRPQGHVRENHELIQDACNKAQRYIDEGGPAVAGIKRHKIAENLVNGYQRIFGPRGIEVEVWYKNGERLPKGASKEGAVRIDALDYDNRIIYDYKFVKNPGRGMGPKQAKNYLEHMPEHIRHEFRVIEVNPIM